MPSASQRCGLPALTRMTSSGLLASVDNVANVFDGRIFGAAALAIAVACSATGESTEDSEVRHPKTRAGRQQLPAGPSSESASWAEVKSAVTPPARDSAVMVYDTARGNSVLFGGEQCAGLNCANTTLFGDTWTWDGATWLSHPSLVQPQARFAHAMVFDDSQKVGILFGGYLCANAACETGNSLSDTWQWDGSQWQKRSPAASPTSRDSHAMAYDSFRKVIVLFGGETASGKTLGDTWEYDGATWAKRSPAAAPSARQSHAMAYDSARHVTVLFGGYSCSNTSCTPQNEVGDTWEYDGTTWVNRIPAVAPSPRDSFGMTYDTPRGKTILFGGAGSSETWEWDGVLWQKIATAKVPSIRLYFPLAFDRGRGRVVLFSGSSVLGQGLSDTWEFASRGGACTTGSQCDSGSCVDGVCCDSASCATCQSCNTALSPGKCAPVLSAPDPPNCDGTQSCDAAGQCKLAKAQPCSNGGAECATGACVDGFCCASACNQGCEVCSQSLGAPENGTCFPARSGYAGAPRCSGGFVCDGKSTTCPNGGAICDGQHTLTGVDGQQTDCTPYACNASTCLSLCTTASDCVSPAVCDASRQCVLPPGAGVDDASGCAVSARKPSNSTTVCLSGLMLLGSLAVLRRKRLRKVE